MSEPPQYTTLLIQPAVLSTPFKVLTMIWLWYYPPNTKQTWMLQVVALLVGEFIRALSPRLDRSSRHHNLDIVRRAILLFSSLVVAVRSRITPLVQEPLVYRPNVTTFQEYLLGKFFSLTPDFALCLIDPNISTEDVYPLEIVALGFPSV